jgi:hypothetical protein
MNAKATPQGYDKNYALTKEVAADWDTSRLVSTLRDMLSEASDESAWGTIDALADLLNTHGKDA